MTGEDPESLRVAAPPLDLEDDRVRAQVASRLFGSAQTHHIGHFEVLGRIGSGANGVVYEALDPKLGRKVALKVVHVGEGVLDTETSHGPSPRSAEILREARAVARLEHPNIVAVHDAGTDAGHLWIAMELVEGGTLREWSEASAPTWSDVVDVFVGIGEGLDAAHRAGLVHRDFKPDNVLLGDDQHQARRPRIVDFGLSWVADEPDPFDRSVGSKSNLDDATATSGRPRVDSQATAPAHRRWVGTPSYMAPELFDGFEATAASDQFAFFASLFEVLHGVRPFAGRTVQALQEAARRREFSRARRPWPRWLKALVHRGLHPDPAQRWPSMTAVVERLRRQQARRARRPLAIGVAVVAAGLGAAASVMARPDPCAGATRSLDELWDETRRQAVSSALVGIAPSGDPGFVDRALQGLDEWSTRWSTARRGACEAEGAGESSQRIADLRAACHADQLQTFAGLIGGLAELDANRTQAFGRVLPAIDALPSPALCEDETVLRRREGALLDPARGAADPAEAKARAELQRELARLEGRIAAGPDPTLDDLLESAAERAQSLDFPAAMARVRRLRAGQAQQAGDHPRALELSSQALESAIAARDDLEASRASLHLLWVSGELMRDPETAERWRGIADAYLESLGDPPPGRVDWLEFGAVVDLQAGDLDAAEAALNQALELRESDEVLAAGRFKTLNNLATLASQRGEYEKASKLNLRAMDAIEAHLGPAHPSLAMAMSNQGSYLHRQGDEQAALDWLERALSLKERVFGPDHPQLISTLNNLGPLVEPIRARALYQRAIDIGRARFGPDSPRIANATFNLAITLHDLGEHATSLEHYRRFAEIMGEAYGADHPAVWSAQVAAASERVHLGEVERGLEALEELGERLESSDASKLGPYDTSDYWIQMTRARQGAGDRSGAVAAASRAKADCDAVPELADCLPQDVGDLLHDADADPP